MYKILYWLSVVVTIICGLLLALRAEADFMELQEVSVDYKNYKIISESQRDLLVYPESPKESLNLGINLDLFWGYLYANSAVESTTVDSQYRGVGLQERLGVYLGRYAELGYIHHSQHVLDRQIQSIPAFPVTDALELKLYIYRK